MANTARNRPGAEPAEVIEENKTLENIQYKYEKNKKPINTVILAVVVAVVGFFAYLKLYKEPNETKAANSIYQAERYFEADSIGKALNGDGQHAGFLKVIKKYGGTKAGNLAHYYAGMCFLKSGDFKSAIKYLEDFDGKGTVMESLSYGALGDAYMETNNVKKGIDAYEKAASDKDNAAITPVFLFRLGMAYEMDNQNKKAIDAYRRIRDEFPTSMQARDMDKYMARLGELN